jgi:uncharacterized lipoprotein YmbA
MKYWSLFVITLLAVGCSSQPVEPNYYLLRPTAELHSRTLNPSADFALGNVTVASYVDQQGLLLETRTGEIRPARHHLWAEPMYESVRTFLDMEISRAKGADIFGEKFSKDAIVVDIRIDQLHGTYDGKATLVAYWWLHQGKMILSSYQYAESMALSQDGYAALADAEKALLSDLAQKIAYTLVKPAG